jgi:serine/threonine protein kinase
MSEIDASWPTTSPVAHVATTPDRVPVHDALSPGTRLDEFEIVRVLGTGGFGIVYLARDHVLLRDVAIKEYMPAAERAPRCRCARTASPRPSPRASNRS